MSEGGLRTHPVLVGSWSVPGRGSEVLERLSHAVLQAVRDERGPGHDPGHDSGIDSGQDPGFAWLDSGGPTLSKESESVVSAFAWSRVSFHEADDPRLPQTLAAFADADHDRVGGTNGQDGNGRLEGAGPRFRGGWIGFLGYEAVEAFEPVRLGAVRDLPVPVASWGLFPVWYRLHHGSGRLELWSRLKGDPERGPLGVRPGMAQWSAWAEQAIEEATGVDEGRLHGSRVDVPSPGNVLEDPRRSFTPEGFMRAVDVVKEAVREGEVFQANLAHRLSLPSRADPFQVYLRLRRMNPSPFMGFLEDSWGALVSNSPERLFCVRHEEGHRVIQVRPIAGTRPRGRDGDEESRLRRDLTTSGKERAEHTMLVDLLRNDVGRVSAPGTVRVVRFQEVEAYSHVLHLVSRVEGRLRGGVGVDDLVRSLFPGGTVTGAPKLRSIEVIDRVEPVARGPYTGSLGYVNPDGSMDLNILIRTLIMCEGRAHAYAGAGVVAQSEADKEFEETLHKASAMLLALGQELGETDGRGRDRAEAVVAEGRR